MPEVSRLSAIITLNSTAFERGLLFADNRLSKFARGCVSAGTFVDQMGQRMSNFGGVLNRTVTIPLAAAAVAIGAFGKRAIGLAISMDSLDKGLTAITGSASGAAKEIANLRRMALEVPGLDFASAAKGALQLRAVRISAKDTAGILETLAKANAIASGSTENYARALEQLNQMIGSGVVQGDEIRIIKEQIATFSLFLKDTFNATTEEIAKAINEGKLSMQDFVEAFIAWGNTLEPPSNTLANLMVRMRNEIDLALADMGKDFIPDLVKLIPQLMDAFRKALPAIKELFRAIADVGVPVFQQFVKVASDLMKWFADLGPATQQFIIKAAGISMLAGPLLSLTGGFIQLFGGILKVTGLGGAIGSWAAGIATKLPALIPIILGVADAWLLLRTAQERAMQKSMDAEFSTGLMNQKVLAYIQIELEAASGKLQKLKVLAKEWSKNMPGKEGQVALEGLRNELGKIGYAMDPLGNVFKAALGGGNAANQFAAIAAKMRTAVQGMSKDAEKAKKDHEALMEDYRSSVSDLERQIFLIDKTGEAWQTSWDIEKGRFKALSDGQRQHLLDLALELTAKQKLAEINNVLDTDQSNRNWLRFAAGEGLMSPLDAARGKVESIKGAIQQLFNMGDVTALAKLPKLFSFLDDAMGQLAVEERIEAIKQKLASLAPAITQAVLGMMAYQNSLVFTTRLVQDNFSAEMAHANVLKAVQFGLQAAMKGVDFYIKRQQAFQGIIQDLNIEFIKLTQGQDAATRAALKLNHAFKDGDIETIMSMQKINDELLRMKELSEDVARSITDAFMEGLEKIRTEGFGGFLRSFEKMLLDMALSVLRAQVFQFLNQMLSGVFGAATGGGGGGGFGFLQGSPGGFGGFGGGPGNLEFAPAGGGVVVNMTVVTPDAQSFKDSQPQLMADAFRQGYTQQRRNRGRF